MNGKKPFIERLEAVIKSLNLDGADPNEFQFELAEHYFDAECTEHYVIKAVYHYTIRVFRIDTDERFPMDRRDYVVIPRGYDLVKRVKA